jgi:hypothetical protein
MAIRVRGDRMVRQTVEDGKSGGYPREAKRGVILSATLVSWEVE